MHANNEASLSNVATLNDSRMVDYEIGRAK